MAMHGLPQGIISPPRPLREGDEEKAHASGSRLGPAPGTMILVFVFLVAFIVYYFTNWKLLSFVWQIG